jgi:hypothetical protein
MSAFNEEPDRVVDRHNYGWYRASDGRGGSVYCFDYHTRIPNYTTLVAARGPVRPVLPVEPDHVAELDRLLALAGRRAITSIAAAFESVFSSLRDAATELDDCALLEGDDEMNHHASFEFALRTLKAGRPGSWESALIAEVVFAGRDLQVDHDLSKVGRRTARRTGDISRRVHRKARDQIAAIITGWVTNPERYTEVAETLACIVSRHADQYGLEGWRMIADRRLERPAFEGFGACYRLFYSRSEHYNLDWADWWPRT